MSNTRVTPSTTPSHFIGLITFCLCTASFASCAPLWVLESDGSLRHRVNYRGETLASISRWYTGTQRNWRKIQAANGGVDPTKIYRGDIILIPREIVRTTTPYPGPSGTSARSTEQDIQTYEVRKPELPEETDPDREKLLRELVDQER